MTVSPLDMPVYCLFTHNSADPEDCHCNECFGRILITLMAESNMSLREMANTILVPPQALVDFIWGAKTHDGLPFASN